MTVNSTPFTTASFFTSFTSNKRSSLGLPTSPMNRSFLQSPLWNTIATTNVPHQQEKNRKEEKEIKQCQVLQQAIYVLPKLPSHVTVYLQLPAFRSLSVLMRCGHVSRLVENWLCNPIDQLKRNAEKAYQQQQEQQEQKQKTIRRQRSSSLCILPISEEEEEVEKSDIITPFYYDEHNTDTLPAVNNNNSNSLVLYRQHQLRSPSSLFIHFQMGQQSQLMEIQYNHVPCLFTVVCVTYHCGSVSISINQIESLDFLSLTGRMNPFLLRCDLKPNHPVTIRQLASTNTLSSNVPQICDYASEDVEIIVNSSFAKIEEIQNEVSSPANHEKLVTFHHHDSKEAYKLEKEATDAMKLDVIPVFSRYSDIEDVRLMHLEENVLYHEEEDDDESWLYSSSEEFSVLEDLDTEEESEDDAAQAALLRLVQDTLEYIQSSGGALSEELNKLEYRLHNYCCANATSTSSVY